MNTVMDPPISPMLATTGLPPTRPGWAHEFKWDGQRAIATILGDQLRLTARPREAGRPGNNITDTYPELNILPELCDERSVVLDGEIVALADGRPSLRLLQRRMGARPTALLVDSIPAFYQVFDLLSLDGDSVMHLPYSRRRELLTGLALNGKSNRVQMAPSYNTVDGRFLLDVARVHGIEGIVSKRESSKYQPGKRSRDWIKTLVAEVAPK